MTRHSEIQLYRWPTSMLQSVLVRFVLVWDEITWIEFKQLLNHNNNTLHCSSEIVKDLCFRALLNVCCISG